MAIELKTHFQKYIEISEENFQNIVPYFKTVSVKKKQNLLMEGKICTSNYFVVKGCLRMFFVNEKGVEHTILFALENWWLSDYSSFSANVPSGFYIQAVENSEVLAITCQEQEEMLMKFPVMEKYFRKMHQKAHSASQVRMKKIYQQSREEHYVEFSKNYPEFVQRIPQYLLASFLGITPEYLSEIRSKKLS